ncbi:MAG: MBL fold metallo-hydrolase [Parcubacteria group bacterium]|nr:MBL fold metallo-hydrolase [Parcubacteria group bacterium]
MGFLKKNAVQCFLGVLFFANAFIWYAVFKEERGDILTVAFLDVGQGDAIFIEAPNGNQMLIDGGGGAQVLRRLGRIMPFYDRSIDVLLATHPDKDHVGGLPDVLNRYHVAMVMEPGVESDTAVYAQLEQLIENKNITKILARRGMKLKLSEGVYLHVLFPDRDPSGMDTNDASIVARLMYGDTSFLLTGDSPQKIEQYLVSLDGSNLNADVLKAGHHGSKTSSSETFIGHTSPEYVIISAGANNSYGHPHQEVLDRFEVFGSVIMRTDELGTIVFESDGNTLHIQ